MKTLKMNNWWQLINGLALGVIVATSFAPIARAQPAPKPTLVGQCRAAKQATAIFKTASATSAVVTALKIDAKVTLAADTATDGFIAVSAPSAGFVQTVNLKLCATNTVDKGLCRSVAQAQGLVIRQEPTTTSAVLGEAAANSQVTLTTSPATAKTDTTGRIWIQIAAPQKGWVSNGFAQGGSNLVFCK